MRINILLKLAEAFFSKAIEIESIETTVNRPGIDEQISDLEQSAFSKYEEDYTSDPYDVKDDVSQPGSSGFAIIDNDKLLGYIYGYDFIYEDNWEDLDPESEDIKWLEPTDISEIEEAAKNRKIFYITNLAIKPEYGSLFLALALALKAALKKRNYKYIIFNALSDSHRLLVDDAGNMRTFILNRFGIKPIAEKYDGETHDYLCKVIA